MRRTEAARPQKVEETGNGYPSVWDVTTQPSPPQLPPIRDDDVRIERASPANRRAAIARVLAAAGRPELPAADRFIAYSAANQIALDHLWLALGPRSEARAACLAVANPGRTAVFFAGPYAAPALPAVIDATCGDLAAHDITLAQVLFDPTEGTAFTAFEHAGFRRLAAISYLERPLDRRSGRSALAPLPPDVTLVPYDDRQRDDVCRILEASYVDTLDCPGLRGLRRTEDIFAGHQGTGVFDPTLWTVLRVDDVPRGILMFNAIPTSQTLELVYLGLDAAVRGRGLGALLLAHGLAALSARSERAITLAVDDDNSPATALYRRAGFRRVLRRIAMIRDLTPLAPSP